jgi:hypothetical protein
MAKFLKMESVKFTKALDKSRGDKYLALMALNVMNNQLGTGPESFSTQITKQGPNWKALSDRYRKRKMREGFSDRMWVRTGKFIKSISKEMTKIGAQNGVNLKYNKSKKSAYLDMANAMGQNGKKKNAAGKREVFFVNSYKRPFVYWTNKDIELAISTTAKSLTEIFKKEGLA